jgi:FkbM family methyltransferase
VSAVGFRNLVKILARSRSVSFTANMVRQPGTSCLARMRWSGQEIFYRTSSTDPFVIYQVLLKRGKKAEYYVPRGLKPKIILDIGSNIGASIIYFRRRFPDAKIFGFEPHPDTFRILQSNVANLAGVTIFNYGLGAADRQVAVRADQVNFGAFSTHADFKDRGQPAAAVECEIRRLDEVLRQLGIAQVDLIKIDCEGAEADVFSTLSDEMLNRCQWIVGEFHDNTAFDVMARLAPHFQLDLKKKIYSPRFRFHACNISKMQELSHSDLDALQR